jgi:hypothetical protein
MTGGLLSFHRIAGSKGLPFRIELVGATAMTTLRAAGRPAERELIVV